jgi:hypothetical protein
VNSTFVPSCRAHLNEWAFEDGNEDVGRLRESRIVVVTHWLTELRARIGVKRT